MRKIENKSIGLLLLAVVNVACDSSLQDNESVTGPVIAADPLADVTPLPEEVQPANSTTETTITGFDSPNTTPSPAETPTGSETPSAAETPTDSGTPTATETPTDSGTPTVTETATDSGTPTVTETPANNNENSSVNETPSVPETPSPPETNADAIVDNTIDDLTDIISVGNTSYESVSTNGGTSASASTTGTASLDLSNLPDTTTTVFGNTDDNYCAEVGDIFDINISGSLIDNGTEVSAVSLNSYSTIDLENHPNVQLVSQSDESIAVAVTTSDIVDLIVQYEHQTDLIYLSATTPEIPKPYILKNEYQDGNCSFALYTDSGCAVLASDINMVTATVGNTSITAQGCTLGNPEQLPVIDLQE